MTNSEEVMKAKVALPWVSLEGSEKFYNLNAQELEFFKAATGLHEEAELKAHMIAVQHEAYAVRRIPVLPRDRTCSWNAAGADPCIPVHSDVLLHKVRAARPERCIDLQ